MNTTTNYGLGKPLTTENYDIAIQNDNMDAIDTALKANSDATAEKETPAGAQAKADAAAGAVATALGEHLAENATLIDAVNTNNYVFSTGKNITLENLKIYTFRCSNSSTDNVTIKIDNNPVLPLKQLESDTQLGNKAVRVGRVFQAWYLASSNCFYLLTSRQVAKLSEHDGCAITISNLDLNTIFDTGFYEGSSLINAPTAATWVYVEVIQHVNKSGYCIQKAYPMGSLYDCYIRQCNNNVWTTWKKTGSDKLLEVISGGSKVQSGIVSVSATANIQASSPVTFPTAFASAPTVIIGVLDTMVGDGKWVWCSAAVRTANGFTAYCQATLTGTIVMAWVAIGS